MEEEDVVDWPYRDELGSLKVLGDAGGTTGRGAW